MKVFMKIKDCHFDLGKEITMKTGKQWFKNQLIRTKILLIYVPLIIIPLFCMECISNYIFSGAVIQETVKNVTDNATLIVTQINTMMEGTQNCANIMTLGLIKLLTANVNYNDNHAAYIEMNGKIENELSTIKITFPFIDSSAFIDQEGNIFCIDDSMKKNTDIIHKKKLLQKIEKCNTENQWMPMQKRNYFVTDSSIPVLTLAKKIINPKNGKTFGVLILNIKETAISDIYRNMGPENIASDFVVDEKGKIVSSENGQELLKTLSDEKLKIFHLYGKDFSKIMSVEGNKMLVTSTSIGYLNWRFVSVIPIRDLLADINKNKVAVIFVSGICLLFALMTATILSNIIVKPIVNLSQKMNEIKDENLDIVCAVESNDEIGKLASGFNMMITRIKDLLNKSVQEQKKLRKYELALIQAQIKPHFLYNSLELIYTLCGMSGAKEAQAAVKSLANFYRIALSKGQEVISLEDEIKNVNDYLNIQRYRYCDVFDYNINIQDEIKKSRILKLTLQPLVENAIYHGLKTKGSFGQLSIEGYLNGQNVDILIKDDGIGMSEEKIEEIFANDKSLNNTKSFGLRSVDERIKLFFGEAYGLTIESESGKGTTITVTIPFPSERS